MEANYDFFSCIKSVVGGLIGTVSSSNNGLIDKKYAIMSKSGSVGLVIDYNVDSDKLYTSTSLIETYIYSGGNVSFYRILLSPLGNNKVHIRYIGINCCDFKFLDNKLYILPNSTDSVIVYRYALGRRLIPIFYTIQASDFSSITGDVITPEPD